MRVAPPAAIGVLVLDEPVEGSTAVLPEPEYQPTCRRERSHSQQHAAGAIDQVFFFLCMLIAEPQRRPGAVGTLTIALDVEAQACDDDANHPC